MERHSLSLRQLAGAARAAARPASGQPARDDACRGLWHPSARVPRPSPSRLRSLTGLVPLLALFGALAGPGPAQAATHECPIPNGGEHLGPTYLTALSVSSTGCSTGLKVVRAYRACQVARGGGGTATCNRRLDGFSCTEKRGPTIPTEFYSAVSCRHGSARVKYSYAQFT
jgi:hypothetical protein